MEETRTYRYAIVEPIHTRTTDQVIREAYKVLAVWDDPALERGADALRKLGFGEDYIAKGIAKHLERRGQ